MYYYHHDGRSSPEISITAPAIAVLYSYQEERSFFALICYIERK